jgi:hypothetical protein
MDGSKNGHARVPVAAAVAKGSTVPARAPGTSPVVVPVGASRTAAVAKGSTVPAAWPARALVPALKNS